MEKEKYLPVGRQESSWSRWYTTMSHERRDDEVAAILLRGCCCCYVSHRCFLAAVVSLAVILLLVHVLLSAPLSPSALSPLHSLQQSKPAQLSYSIHVLHNSWVKEEHIKGRDFKFLHDTRASAG